MPNPDRTQVNEKYPHVPEAAVYELTRSTDEPGPGVLRGGARWPVNPELDQALFDNLQRARQQDAPGTARAEVPVFVAVEPPPARPDWALDLETWWIDTATSDIGGSIQKIVDYGGKGAAYDLVATGHDLAAMNGRTVGDEEAVELAICFYLSSKANRWMAAIIDGRRPSDDTLLDIAYYAMMARRNRVVGGWPVGSE